MQVSLYIRSCVDVLVLCWGQLGTLSAMVLIAGTFFKELTKILNEDAFHQT